MTHNNRITVISGATATGKTSVSIELAKRLSQEKSSNPIIINFDSLLFYKELNIGTAKPSVEEQSGINHEMISIVSAKEELNASSYIKKVLPIIENAQKQNREIIMVGGSAFYIRALLKGMYDSPTTPESVKKEVLDLYTDKDILPIREILKEKDPISFNQLHQNDHYRNIRALEHFLTTGSPLSEQKELFDKNDPYDFNKNIHNWDISHIYLEIEKERHWKIMEKRALKMIDEGLIPEIETLLSAGFTGKEKPLNSIGYKETISYLSGEISSKDELLEKIYFSTRRLAKAQKTFFKKVKHKNSFNSMDNSITEILNSIGR